MKIVVAMASLGLSIEQSGLGPVVTLGFGPNGAPGPLALLPVVTTIGGDDQVLVFPGGVLSLISTANLAAALNGTTSNIVLES
jgi:hypothetical protein